MHELATTGPPIAATPAEVLQCALFDSRQRWRDLVDLAADFAFETDEWGRFTFITPELALGWAAGPLIGQPSASLLTDAGDGLFDPFRVSARIRHRRAWLKRGDGGVACLTFWAAPMRDGAGRITGARGVGIDMTDLDFQAAEVAGSVRRAEVMDHILRRMGQEVTTSGMMDVTLGVVANAVGAEGVAVVTASTIQNAFRVAHVTGTGAEAVMPVATQRCRPDERQRLGTENSEMFSIDGRPVVTAACQTRFGEAAGLVAWRLPDARPWDGDDSLLMRSSVYLVRMILEREATQRDMAQQARTDPLTGLLNRRAFLEEMERHAARQDRDAEPATLMFADLDNFKPVNDLMGHEAGDDVLRCIGILLRKTFRPTDLIARLGGDEFAIWLNGADHMTAAERAEFLRDAVPRELAEITSPDVPRVGVSIGIACREPGSGEPLDSLMRRADRAMYELKRGGRGHWRVSLLKRP
jgi:diguanylate cyclase (GGDEF)-like protein